MQCSMINTWSFSKALAILRAKSPISGPISMISQQTYTPSRRPHGLYKRSFPHSRNSASLWCRRDTNSAEPPHSARHWACDSRLMGMVIVNIERMQVVQYLNVFRIYSQDISWWRYVLLCSLFDSLGSNSSRWFRSIYWVGLALEDIKETVCVFGRFKGRVDENIFWQKC